MAFNEAAFSISPVPATLAGAAILREIETSAHEDNPTIPLLWPRQHTDPEPDASNPSGSSPEQDKEQDERTLGFLLKPENHHHLVTEKATGKGVAYVWWQECKGKTEADWAEAYEKRYRNPRMNQPLSDATNGARLLKRATILGDKDFYMLKELYVRPECQRQGIGSRLVKWGIDEADKLGLPAYTEASPQGLGLYLKYGFEEIDRVTVDLGDWGGEKGVLNSFGLLYRAAK